eukprot:maker-scaffold1780_size28297-snap-gene-0.5 protein:Tk01399 transcript:maker-scaffold1780_size28297-snap-gene-0.5-mRNA-1 annotation:"dipeptidase 1"
MAYTAKEIEKIQKREKIAILIGVEGGHMINSNLAILRLMYQMGVRYMTLTHSCHTPWADAYIADTVIPETKHDYKYEEGISNGLSIFGKRLNKDIVVATLAHLLQKCDVQAAIEELELGPPTITKVDISPELDSDIATALANATLEAAAVADLEDEKVKRATTPPPSEVVLTVRGSASQAKKTICVSLWKGVECAHPATCNRTHLPLCTSVDCKP